MLGWSSGNDTRQRRVLILDVPHFIYRMFLRLYTALDQQPGDCWSMSATLRVRVVPPVLRSRFVREDFVEDHIVGADAINAICHAHHDRSSQIAKQGADGDIDNIIAEATAIRPATGNDSVAEAWLHCARQHVVAENSQP